MARKFARNGPTNGFVSSSKTYKANAGYTAGAKTPRNGGLKMGSKNTSGTRKVAARQAAGNPGKINAGVSA